MILFYVQHLLGSGHLQRIRLIADELACRGIDVTVVSGGMPIPGTNSSNVDWLQLEPVQSSGIDFASIVDADGAVAGEALFARRAQALIDVCRRLRPRGLVVESYPFGRRQFRAEIDAMLQRVRDNPGRAVIACSIRDILQRRRDDREMETVRRVRESFDAVLVHGDPGIIALDESFGRAAKIRDKLVYTGYVASAPVPRTLFTDEIAGDIVVAAGGGAAGAQLYQVALDAANRDDLGRRWRLLVGAAVDEGAFRRMQREAGPATRVERNRADFRELLARSRILVSQAGYNTLTDILVTGVPALLVPFESVGETEQLARARRFERLGRVDVLRECDLDPEALLERLSEAMTKPEPGLPEIDLGGIGYTADWIIDHALTC